MLTCGSLFNRFQVSGCLSSLFLRLKGILKHFASLVTNLLAEAETLRPVLNCFYLTELKSQKGG